MASYSLVWNLGKQVQGPAFCRICFTRAFPTLQGSIQFETICWLKVLNLGRRESRHSFKSHVGIASLLHYLFGNFCISFLTSSSVRGRKERNISSSFTGTLGIVIGSLSWLSKFFLIFWNFNIKKSPNASARSFNESESGYCYCCNGLGSDLMIPKSFFFYLQHISELFQSNTPSLPRQWRICNCCTLIYIQWNLSITTI